MACRHGLHMFFWQSIAVHVLKILMWTFPSFSNNVCFLHFLQCKNVFEWISENTVWGLGEYLIQIGCRVVIKSDSLHLLICSSRHSWCSKLMRWLKRYLVTMATETKNVISLFIYYNGQLLQPQDGQNMTDE